MAARFFSAFKPALAGLLVASTVLGAADALLALWSNRAVAPSSTIPLCLTAPFAVALVSLLPATLVLALVLCRTKEGVRESAALLLAVVGAAAVLRGGGALRAAWHDSGATVLARVLVPGVLAMCAGAAWLCRRRVRALLGRLDARQLSRLVVAAAIVHAAAFAGVVWQLRREGRGVLRSVVAGSVRGASAAAALDVATPNEGVQRVPDNLVLVTIDTLRADHLDAARMPHTTALAASGASFTASYAASPWTLPSMAAVMTGLPALRHGAGTPLGEDPLSRSPLSPRHATLAARLEAAGFATSAIVTNPYLGLGYGLGQGFAAFENVTLESEAALTLRPTLGFWLLERLLPSVTIVDRGAAVTRRAARFLAARDIGARFFLWLHYVDPHAPYDGATRSFRDDLLAGGSAAGKLPRMAQLRAGEIRPSSAGRAALRAAYARAVRAVDDEVGAVVALLDRHGLAARTLVAVTADHGEELWDHGGVEHGHTLFDELLRVPLVIRCPGCAQAGAQIKELVGLDGLAATLLDLLGVAPAPGAEGPANQGFAALLRGEPFAPRPVVSENLLFAEERVALRTERYTYVVWANGKEELYDRIRDPRELRDLAARRRLLRSQRELLASLRGLPSDGAVVRGDATSDGAPVEGTGVRPVTRRALQALGYVE